METRDAPKRAPYQPRPGAPFAGYTLGDLIGWGGFASAYRLPDASPESHSARCIKIGYGADATGRHADRQARIANVRTENWDNPAKVLVWITGLGNFRSVSPQSIGAILAAEYRVLREHPTELLPMVEAAGTDHDLPYYVMQSFAGPSLRAVLAGSHIGNRLNLLTSCAQLIAALRSAHGGTAFIHGDLKPENIIVTADGWRIIDPALRSDAGKVSRVATRAYNPTIDFSSESDLRALTIILFEIVAGWQPFMHLSDRWIYPVMPGDPFGEAWACLRTEQCEHAARQPFFAQLLTWMREPPSYAALAAFVDAPAQRTALTRLFADGDW